MTRRRLSRPLLAVATLGLGAAVLHGCGAVLPGDTAARLDATGAPSDATAQGFCSAYGLAAGLDPDAPADALAEELRASAARLVETGTPADVPAAARRGYAVYVAATSTASEDEARALVGTTPADAASVAEALDIEDDEAAPFDAFQHYLSATCFTLRS